MKRKNVDSVTYYKNGGYINFVSGVYLEHSFPIIYDSLIVRGLKSISFSSLFGDMYKAYTDRYGNVIVRLVRYE